MIPENVGPRRHRCTIRHADGTWQVDYVAEIRGVGRGITEKDAAEAAISCGRLALDSTNAREKQKPRHEELT